MNTILKKTTLGNNTTSIKRTISPVGMLTPLAVILAVIAWILNFGMIAVALISTLPGIGLIMVLKKVQEEADQISSHRS